MPIPLASRTKGFLLAAAILALSAAEAFAATALTVTSQYGPDRPQSVFWRDFREAVNAALPDAYDITIVTGGALGGEKEEAESVRLGAITGALSTVANMTTWVPQGGVLDLPFVFDGPQHVERVLSGPLGERLVEAYRAEGFEVPAFITFGARHLLADRALPDPDDVASLTMRSLQSDLHLEFWRALGADPVPLPITEAYSALGTGVVDAMDLTKSGYDALKLYEVAPVLTETSHMVAVGVVYFDTAFWDSLAPDHRAIFRDAAVSAAQAFDRNAAAEQEAALERAIAAGARRAAADRDRWREATRAFVDEFVAMPGGPTEDGLAAIREARP